MRSRSRRLASLASILLAVSLVAAACGATSTGTPMPTSVASSAAPVATSSVPSTVPTSGPTAVLPSASIAPTDRSSASIAPSHGPTAAPSGGSTAAPSLPTPAPHSPSASPAASSPTPAPTASGPPPLPGLIGAIGDSISVGYNAVPTIFGPQPSHSWVFGTDPNDGIASHLERLRALGADPLVEPAARAGARMSDIVRQATLVVEASARLRKGQIAYVTIELGANDLCSNAPSLMTDTATFAAELRAGLGVLRNGTTVGGAHVAGLPRGSVILVLSVPDVLGLRRLVRSDPIALAIHEQFGQCRSAVDSSRTAADLRLVGARITAFDRALRSACAAIDARDAPTGRLSCRDDQEGNPADSFTGAPLTLADLSHLDYFHPSLEGQARIAAGSWAASYWSASKP